MLSHYVAPERMARHAARLQRRSPLSKSDYGDANPRKRRPRSQPTPSGKRTTITDNDMFGIFEPLSRHAYLTTKQLVAFDRRYASKTRNRLTDLYHEQGEWLVRLSERLKFADALFVDEMYQLGKDAEAALRSRGIIPSEDWVRATRIGGNSTAPSRILRLAHDHMASQVTLDIEIGARAASNVRFRNHIEISARRRNVRGPCPIPCPSLCRRSRTRRNGSAGRAVRNRRSLLRARSRHGHESIEAIIKPKIRAYREIVASRTIDRHFGSTISTCCS